jgi:hypothetical protein
MGPDMYAFTTTQDMPEVNFEDLRDGLSFSVGASTNLHGWMEQLYRQGGRAT